MPPSPREPLSTAAAPAWAKEVGQLTVCEWTASMDRMTPASATTQPMRHPNMLKTLLVVWTVTTLSRTSPIDARLTCSRPSYTKCS